MKSILFPVCLLLLAACVLPACGGGSTTTEVVAPDIAGVEPASGGVAGGTPIIIRGTGLANTEAGANEVLVGGNPATDIVVVDDSTIRCITPAGVQGPADVSVTKNSGTGTLAAAYTYHPAPTFLSITPDEGTRLGGTPVVVKGTGFLNNDPKKTVVMIQLKELVDLVVVDDETITGTTPSSVIETLRDVTVANANGQDVMPLGWRYVGPPPIIKSVTPDRGLAAEFTPVVIKGEWFTLAGWPVEVTFGTATAASVQRVDDFTITCLAPPGPPGVWATVTTSNGNGSTSINGDPVAMTGFYYIPPPEVDSVDPASGSVDGGNTVTIMGSGFSGAGTNVVRFNGVLASSVVTDNDGEITCVVPAGTVLGLVSVDVMNDAGTGSKEAYTYTAPDFWWEDTYGTNTGMNGDDPYQLISLDYGFPFYGTTWNDVYAMANGHIDFGSSANSSFSVAENLLSVPHISHMGMDCYVYNPGRTVWYTQHIDGRTIITYDKVPEYSSVGSNSVQIHLHQSGIFCILYNGITFKNASGYSATARVAINPGGGTSKTVDWTAGVTGATATDALNQVFTGLADLDGGHMICTPNTSGGYDVEWKNTIPSDPN